ncbi:MAG TPA: hypothetical protein VFS50_08620 [Meiothermus sp.]|nr:hypothetical protein [Meiothermus sp.]
MVIQQSVPRPYPPSWIDWLYDWVERRPLAFGLLYGAMGLSSFTAETLVKWWDGSYPVGSINLFHFINSSMFAIGLGLVHYLRKSARATFAHFRPFLPMNDHDSDIECYKLTTARSHWALLASLLGVSWALLQHQTTPAKETSLMFTSPPASVVDMTILLVFWWTLGGLIYWLIHYLRASGKMHRKSNADLMRPQALYVFSGLNLRIVIGVTFINYAWLYFAPRQSLQYSDYLTCLVVEFVVLAAFIWPAWGIHVVLLKEKRRLQDEAHAKIERLVTQLYVEIDMGSYQQMDGVFKGLVALQTETALLERSSTWPWPVETPRLLATAILVPILLWITQRLLEHFGI